MTYKSSLAAGGFTAALLWVGSAAAQLGGFTISGDIEASFGQSQNHITGAQTTTDTFDVDVRLQDEYSFPGSQGVNLDLQLGVDQNSGVIAIEEGEVGLSYAFAYEMDLGLRRDSAARQSAQLIVRNDSQRDANLVFDLEVFDDATRDLELEWGNTTSGQGRGILPGIQSVYFVQSNADTSHFITPDLSQAISTRRYAEAYNSPVFSADAATIAQTSDSDGGGGDGDGGYFDYYSSQATRHFTTSTTPGNSNTASAVSGGGRSGASASIIGMNFADMGRLSSRFQVGVASDTQAREVGLEFNFSDLAIMTAHSSSGSGISSEALTLHFSLFDSGLLLNYGIASRADQGRTISQFALYRRFGDFALLTDYSQTLEANPTVSDTTAVDDQLGFQFSYDNGALGASATYADETLYNGQANKRLTLATTQRFAPNAQWELSYARASQTPTAGVVTDPSSDAIQFGLQYDF